MKEYLWVEAYRPHSIEDCVLPQELKSIFKSFVDSKEIPNLLLTGTAGVGKTTVAKAMLDEIGADYIVINGSLNGNIDVLRTEIKDFASTVSFTNSRKYVILDEADYLNAQSTQPALRNFMEEYSKNCGFILTCNYKNRIIEPLVSRCAVVDFQFNKEERPKLAMQFFKRASMILAENNVEYDKAVLAEIINKYFPDFRRIINELQRYSVTGKIDVGILANNVDTAFKELVGYIKTRNFPEARKWVSDNNDIETSVFFRTFYDQSSAVCEPSSIPQLIMILADYQYKAAFVVDQEINKMACVVEIMSEINFK